MGRESVVLGTGISRREEVKAYGTSKPRLGYRGQKTGIVDAEGDALLVDE